MPLAFYDLPNGFFGLLICGGWVLVGVGGHIVFHRVCRVRFSDGDKNLSLALLAVMATVNSLLLAFSAVAVWEAFGAASKAVDREAVTISALSRGLAVYGTAESQHAREQLRQYGDTVVTAEWPAMKQGTKRGEIKSDALDTMFRAVSQLSPSTPREEALMPEIWARTNELVVSRRERLFSSHAKMPGTLWIVVVAGTLLTIATTYVFPRTAFNLAAVGLLSGVFGLVFFFIGAMDRPFVGRESITEEPIKVALSEMKAWDEAGRKSGPALAQRR